MAPKQKGRVPGIRTSPPTKAAPKGGMVTIHAVSFEALALEQPLRFPPPMITLAKNPAAFDYQWHLIQYVFDLADPSTFGTLLALPVHADDLTRFVLRGRVKPLADKRTGTRPRRIDHRCDAPIYKLIEIQRRAPAVLAGAAELEDGISLWLHFSCPWRSSFGFAPGVVLGPVCTDPTFAICPAKCPTKWTTPN